MYSLILVIILTSKTFTHQPLAITTTEIAGFNTRIDCINQAKKIENDIDSLTVLTVVRYSCISKEKL